MAEAVAGVAACFVCKAPFMFDIECVNSVWIDPETKRPPDVDVVHGKATRITPSREASARSERHPICDVCVGVLNRTNDMGIQTMEDRHRERWSTPLGVHD
jgi:hypothetical protein